MKYEDFVCFVQTGVCSKLGEEVEVELHHIRKNNNVELDGLSFNTRGSRIAPTVYLNCFFDEYKRGKDIPEIVECICNIYKNSKIEGETDLVEYTDYEKVKEHLACKLINRERNRELLKNVPYRKFLNLAIVVYYKVENEVLGNGSIIVLKSHLEMWDVSEEELFYEARKNTRRILPDRFSNIMSILKMESGFDAECEEELPMYVLTNKENCFGAVCIIYDSILKEIGEVLQDDFWIIPSSIHECIIIPKSVSLLPGDISSMIFQANNEVVSREEYLSDDLYSYDRDLHKLKMVETKMN